MLAAVFRDAVLLAAVPGAAHGAAGVVIQQEGPLSVQGIAGGEGATAAEGSRRI